MDSNSKFFQDFRGFSRVNLVPEEDPNLANKILILHRYFESDFKKAPKKAPKVSKEN